ncbi:CHAT domain-containing protein [Ephemerocybe angulata]|uniref:CHAT domain-containing protein n=1 Tax=Ephemerocybe angulata TaxID=980116 RepID=A0A8H6HAD7_9AGAR|nr:CHAT domain-containing protein [Tulosesus angulatus]
MVESNQPSSSIQVSPEEGEGLVQSVTVDGGVSRLSVPHQLERHFRTGRLSYESFHQQKNLRDLDDVIMSLKGAFELAKPDELDPIFTPSSRGSSTALDPARFPRELTATMGMIGTGFLQLDDSSGSSEGGRIVIVLRNLASAYLVRFKHAGSLQDLDESIVYRQMAIRFASESYTNLPYWRQDLAHSHIANFLATNDVSHLDKAIDVFATAIDTAPSDHPAILAMIFNRANALLQRSTYHDARSPGAGAADTDSAISERRRGIELARRKWGGEMLSRAIYSNGLLLKLRYNRTHDDADIRESIATQRDAIDVLSAHSPSHGNIRMMQFNLAETLWIRYQSTSDVEGINDAISTQQRALEATPRDTAEYANNLSQLGTILLVRFMRLGDTKDIDTAVDSQRLAITCSPSASQDLVAMGTMHTNLGSSLTQRFKHGGFIADIDEAIEHQRMAGSIVPDTSRYVKSSILTNLGNSLTARFQSMGSVADIEEAVVSYRKSVELQQGEAAGASTMALKLNNLASALAARFERLRQVEDIEEAILIQTDIVNHTSLADPDRPLHLINLGKYFVEQYLSNNAIANLEKAVAVQEQAVTLTPADHPDLPTWLTNLGKSLHYRREMKRKVGLPSQDDARMAVNVLQRAVDLYPSTHTSLPDCVMNLGLALFDLSRSQEGGIDPITLDAAFDAFRKAISQLSSTDARLPRFRSNLGNMLSIRSQLEHNVRYLRESIDIQREAVSSTPDTHADLTLHLSCLGESLEWLADTLEDEASRDSVLKEARECYRRAALSKTGGPSLKLLCALKWNKIPIPNSPADALAAAETIVNLLPLAAGLDQTPEIRHGVISRYPGLVSSAAGVAFVHKEAEKALEWLEHGRCLVWTQLNALRTPVDDLRIRNPDLAERVLRISSSLETISSRAASQTSINKMSIDMMQIESYSDDNYRHVKLAREWNEVVTSVRDLPGFEDFLSPPTTSFLLRGLPESGPVIVINMHPVRCDALALLTAGPDGESVLSPIHLPRFSYARAEELAKLLNESLSSFGVRERGVNDPEDNTPPDIRDSERAARPRPHKNPRRSTNVLKDILAELWTCIVKPILDALAFSPSPETENRIWWCPTGPLTFLPLHAAGIYDDSAEAVTIFDYAVSSYIPTVSSLINANKIRRPLSTTPGLLILSEPTAPGLTPIPGTTKEAHIIEGIAKESGVETVLLDESEATVKHSMDLMQKYSFVHLACHASQNVSEPLRSAFFLYDGVIELSTLIKRNDRLAGGLDVAFLSACQTGSGDKKLSEEAVHLAGGMLAVGYRGVVATMWSIQDKYAPDVAQDFYTTLFEKGRREDGSVDGSQAALALSRAVRRLSKRLDYNDPESFLAWVPYVHYGL